MFNKSKRRRNLSAVLRKILLDLNNRKMLWKHQKYFRDQFRFWKHQKYFRIYDEYGGSLYAILRKTFRFLYPHRSRDDQHLIGKMIKDAGNSQASCLDHFYLVMEERFPLILDNLLLNLETFYLHYADPILSRSYLPPSKTTVRNKKEYNFYRRKFEAAILFATLENLIGPLLQFENLFGESFEELFDFYLKCRNHFTIQKLITRAYYFNRISEEITPYFKFLVQLLDNEFKCRSFNITAECFRLIYFVNDALSNLSSCLKPIFQVRIDFNWLASKRQVFRQTFDDRKKPFFVGICQRKFALDQ
jgi:hypothetical protein